MTTSIKVEAAVLGRRRAGMREHPLDIHLDGDATLRSLLSAIVTQEVAAYEQRRAERSFIAVLTTTAFDDGLANGAVRWGGVEVPAAPSTEVAIATAVQAFEDGLFQVWIDDMSVEDLDGPVQVSESSRVLFLRLIALAGG